MRLFKKKTDEEKRLKNTKLFEKYFKNVKLDKIKKLLQLDETVRPKISKKKIVLLLRISMKKEKDDLFVALLRLHNADVTYKIDKIPYLLYDAVNMHGARLKIIELLLTKGAKPNRRFLDRKTLIMFRNIATVPITKLLIKYGMKINLSDKNGMTAMMYGIERLDVPFVKLLLKHDAKIGPKTLELANILQMSIRDNDINEVSIIDTSARVRYINEIVTLLEAKMESTIEADKKRRKDFLEAREKNNKTLKARDIASAKKELTKDKTNQCEDLISREDYDNTEWINEDDKNFILQVGDSKICHNIDSIKQVVNNNYFYECLNIFDNIRFKYEPEVDYISTKKYFKLFPNNELVEYKKNFFDKPLKQRYYTLKKSSKKLKGIISSVLVPEVTVSMVGKDHCQSGSDQVVYSIIPLVSQSAGKRKTKKLKKKVAKKPKKKVVKKPKKKVVKKPKKKVVKKSKKKVKKSKRKIKNST